MTQHLTRRALLGAAIALVASARTTPAQIDLSLSRRNLTGLWRGTYEEGGYIIAGEIIFQPNGTYRHTQVLGALMTWASGTFTIAENWVHFEIENYGPDEYQGVKQYRPMSETWMVDAFDGRMIDARIGASTKVHYEKVI